MGTTRPFTQAEQQWIDEHFRGLDGGPWRAFTNDELFAELSRYGFVDSATRRRFPAMFFTPVRWFDRIALDTALAEIQ